MEEPASRIHSYRPWLVAAVALGLVTAALMVAVGVSYYLNLPPRAEQSTDATRLFVVQSGESLTGVAQRLYEEGIIRSPLLLRALAKARGTETAIKAGFFRLPAAATAGEILNLLVAGSHDLVRVTVPEGWTINKLAAYLEQQGITRADEFSATARSPELMAEYGVEAVSAEGYLFPDTYYFPRGYPAAGVARHMIDTFFERLAEIHPTYTPDAAAELHDTVILASIVEREYRVASEASVIASVFYNRLGVDVGLESCATIEYIITEIQGNEHPERIFHVDLEIDSAFNTYKWHGLPPGPISSPGMTALQAALFPADTDYWYFVVKDPATGAHQFSTDLSEHSEAKFLYLKGVAAPPSRAHS